MTFSLYPSDEQRAVIRKLFSERRTWRKGQGNVPKNRAYYLKNRERLLARAKEWNANNVERVREIKRAYKQRKKHEHIRT